MYIYIYIYILQGYTKLGNVSKDGGERWFHKISCTPVFSFQGFGLEEVSMLNHEVFR